MRHLFETSTHWQAYDPFSQSKLATFRASGQGIYACAVLIEDLLAKRTVYSAHDPANQVLFDELMASSLWGNATDLSLLTQLNYQDLQKLQTTNAQQRTEKKQFVLANQLGGAWDAVRSLEHGRLDVVLDNAGFELVTDLLLADWLLTLRGTVPRASAERTEAIRMRMEAVHKRIHDASSSADQRPSLLAVSKLHPPSDVLAAYQTGQRHFGENYAQELVEKAHVLPQDIRWHLIGGLQSNKAKLLACTFFAPHTAIPNLFAVESVDSEKLATSLEKALARPENELRREYPLYVYLQVNTSNEEGKSGVPPMHTAWTAGTPVPPLVALAKHILLACPHLRLAGLMTIGALSNSESSRTEHHNPDFEALCATRAHLVTSLCQDPELKEQLAQTTHWCPAGSETNAYAHLLNTPQALALSMGMSADLEAAIAYGSAQVRIGSDCFGARTNNQDAAKVRAQDIARVAEVPLVKQIVFHTKNMPWFVSDTCVPDVWFTLEKLQDAAFFGDSVPDPKPIRAMAARWAQHFRDGRFRLQMPHDAPLGADAGDLAAFWTEKEGYGAMVRAAC